MKKFQPQFGAVYKALKYTEDNTFARFFPIWFMLKRYVFVTMVFNFDFTHGMIVFSFYLNLIDAVMVTWEDGISREICYRPTSKWMGVGYRGNRGDRYVNRCQSNLGADNGGGFFFSKGNTLITFP